MAEWHDLDTLHGRRAPYAPGKVYLYAGRVGLGICKPYHTRPGSGGKLRFYTVVSPYHPTPLIWVKLNPSMVL